MQGIPQPEQSIRPEFLSTYRAQQWKLSNLLDRLRTNILILEQLTAFGIYELFEPGSILFWYATEENAYDTVILHLTMLLEPSDDPEHLTLRRFATSTIDWLKDDYKARYEQEVDLLPWAELASAPVEAIKTYRTHRVAHTLWPLYATGPKRPLVLPISHESLMALWQYCEVTWNGLGLMEEFIFALSAPDHGKMVVKDLRRALIATAESSPLLDDFDDEDVYLPYPTPRKLDEAERKAWRKEWRVKIAKMSRDIET